MLKVGMMLVGGVWTYDVTGKCGNYKRVQKMTTSRCAYITPHDIDSSFVSDPYESLTGHTQHHYSSGPNNHIIIHSDVQMIYIND